MCIKYFLQILVSVKLSHSSFRFRICRPFCHCHPLHRWLHSHCIRHWLIFLLYQLGRAIQFSICLRFRQWSDKLGSSKLASKLLVQNKQHNSPYSYVIIILIGKAEELKSHQCCFISGIYYGISETELHFIFFLHKFDLAYKFFQFCEKVIRYILRISKCCKCALEFRTALEYFKACCLSFSIKWTDIIVSSKCIKSTKRINDFIFEDNTA